MDFIKETSSLAACQGSRTAENWPRFQKQELLMQRKLKEKAILRFKRQIEEIDFQIALLEKTDR